MIIRGTLGRDGRPITAKQREELDRAARVYDQKVRNAIARDKRFKKKPKRGTMRGRYLKALYGK